MAILQDMPPLWHAHGRVGDKRSKAELAWAGSP